MTAPELGWNPRRLAADEQPTANYLRPSDEQMAECTATLAGLIGEDEAAKPSWQRRLAISGETGELVLLLDCPTLCLSSGDGAHDVAPERGARLSEWLGVQQLAFPAEVGIRLLGSTESPEREGARRRAIVKTRDELRAKREAERKAKEDEAHKAELEATERRERWREPEWERLTADQRLLLTVSLKLESRDPELAAVCRELAALHGGFLPLPRLEWWKAAGERSPSS